MFKKFELENFENTREILEKKLKYNKTEIEKLLEIKNKTYNNFISPYQELSENLNEFITPIFHIDSVKNSELTSKIYEECIKPLTKFESWLGQNQNIYNAILEIQSKEKSSLDTECKKVLENEIRDFKLSGSHLNDDFKKRLEKINLELNELSHKFSQNLLNATNAYEMVIDDEKDIKGLPESDLALAKFEENGVVKYKFTLQIPSYMAYITYGPNRIKREELYKAYCTRAPENEDIIVKILKLKNEKAKILGFNCFSKYSLASKMAKTEKEVVSFLEEIASKAKIKASEELKELKEFAKKIDNIDELKSSDLAYYSEKLKKANYDLDEEYYRPYFQKESVLKGFFEFLNKMFNIEFKEIKEKSWDEKVKIYNILENNKIIAKIFIDLESRKDKRGGAWMNNWQSHYIDVKGNEKFPSAYIVANFPQSDKDISSLLRHGDVVTLFHEMGHALHHLLSKVSQAFVSGISGVAWDCVEFPSQFLEYFAYDKEVLKIFAKHYKTGEKLEDEAIQKIIKSKNFQSSLGTLRQVEFALFDFKLHQKIFNSKEEVQELLDEVRENIAVIVPPKYNKFQNGFSHIFAGGYAAGYYSYKWAEVLSADAFYLFKNSKNIFNKKLANSYKSKILEKGGSCDMDELYYNFANKKPEVDSLLRIDGIVE